MDMDSLLLVTSYLEEIKEKRNSFNGLKDLHKKITYDGGLDFKNAMSLTRQIELELFLMETDQLVDVDGAITEIFNN